MSKATTETAAKEHAAEVGPLFSPLTYVGLPLTVFGLVFTVTLLIFHFSQRERGPLGFDLTLQVGYGGAIFYGILATVIGLLLLRMSRRAG